MNNNEKTLVLDIQELYRVIPDAKRLEGKNFKDIKELLINLIEAIERSGEWEFIQYVSSSKPSLFVIRKAVAGNGFESRHLQEASNILSDVKRIYDKIKRTPTTYPQPDISELNSSYQSVAVVEYEDHSQEASPVLKTQEMREAEKELENMGVEVPIVKLPWE